MNKIEFMKTVQEKLAVSAVGPSALRGQGKGVLYTTQQILKGVDLLRLPLDRQEDFDSWLDEQTADIFAAMLIDINSVGRCSKSTQLIPDRCPV